MEVKKNMLSCYENHGKDQKFRKKTKLIRDDGRSFDEGVDYVEDVKVQMAEGLEQLAGTSKGPGNGDNTRNSLVAILPQEIITHALIDETSMNEEQMAGISSPEELDCTSALNMESVFDELMDSDETVPVDNSLAQGCNIYHLDLHDDDTQPPLLMHTQSAPARLLGLHGDDSLPPLPPQPGLHVTHVDEIVSIDSSPSNNDLPPRMTRDALKKSRSKNIMICDLICSLGGLVIGYLIAVAGGVLGMEKFLHTLSRKAYLSKAHAKQTNFCSYFNQLIGLYVSSLYLSIMVSALLGLRLSTCWGRKPVLITASILLLIGVSLTTWFPTITVEVIGRIILGFGVGLARQVIPIILSEMALEETFFKPEKVFQFQILAGSTVAPLVNFITSRFLVWGWRISFGIVGVPVVLLFLASLAISETPTCLIQQKKDPEAMRALMKIMGTEDIEVDYLELANAIERNQFTNPLKEILNPLSRPALVITTMSQVLVPLAGIDVLMHYGPLLFKSLGLKPDVAFLLPAILGILTTVFAGLSLRFMYVIGRRRELLILGCIAVIVSQICMSIIFYFGVNSYHSLKGYEVYLLISGSFIFVAGYACLSGPHGWLSEVFPQKTNALGSVWEVEVSMFMTFILTQASLGMICRLHVWIFLFPAVCMLVTTFAIYFLVPETKNFRKHELVRRVWSRHRFWKRYISEDDEYT